MSDSISFESQSTYQLIKNMINSFKIIIDRMTFEWACIFACFLNAVPILNGIFD